MLPSRAADNLFWLARYLERAEHTGRLIAVTLEAVPEQTREESETTWRRVIAALSADTFASAGTDSFDITQALAFDALAPGGHSVAVGISAATVKAQYSPFMMVFTEKKISGTFYGSVRPDLDFPVLVDHYMNRKLNLDGLISRTYKLEEINDGFKRMMAGEVARGVVVFD